MTLLTYILIIDTFFIIFFKNIRRQTKGLHRLYSSNTNPLKSSIRFFYLRNFFFGTAIIIIIEQKFQTKFL